MYAVSESPAPVWVEDDRPVIRMPQDAVHLMHGLTLETREVFGAIFLDTRHRAICTPYVVSVGSLNASLVHPREVFRQAIAHCAAAIIVWHTHPSGETTPSGDDLDLTRRLAQAGELLGMTVLDHVVIDVECEQYTSIREYGWPT